MKNIVVCLLLALCGTAGAQEFTKKRSEIAHKRAYDSLVKSSFILFASSSIKDARDAVKFMKDRSVAGVPNSLDIYPIKPAEKSTDVIVVPILSDPMLGDDRKIVSRWSWTNIQHVPSAIYLQSERAVLFAYPFSSDMFWNTMPFFLASFDAWRHSYDAYSKKEQAEKEMLRQDLFLKVVREYYGPAFAQNLTVCVDEMYKETLRRQENPRNYFMDSTYISPLLSFGGKCTGEEVDFRTEYLYRSACFMQIERVCPEKEWTKRKALFVRHRNRYLRSR
jgi:hypothetical protein